MRDSHLEGRLFPHDSETAETLGKYLGYVAAVAFAVAGFCLGYHFLRELFPQHREIVNPVEVPEPPGWGPGDDDEQEDEV